jgi:hypothetical protein
VPPPPLEEGREIIFWESFETAFPGVMWTAYDLNAGWGEDYWDDVTCQAVSGWWSV